MAAENPGINVFNVQPGVVVTTASKMGNGGTALDVDDGECPKLNVASEQKNSN